MRGWEPGLAYLGDWNVQHKMVINSYCLNCLFLPLNVMILLNGGRLLTAKQHQWLIFDCKIALVAQVW